MMKQSRRAWLKGVGFSTVALAGMGAGSSALAMSSVEDASAKLPQSLKFVEPERAIKVYLQQPVGKERVTLVNRSPKAITLDKQQPVKLENINGSLVLTLSKVTGGETVLPAGTVLIFDVAARGDAAEIRSAHPAFNGFLAV